MATAVLRSQDCLRVRLPAETLTSPPFRPSKNSNPNPDPNPTSTRSGRRKGTSVGSQDKEDRRSRCEMTVERSPAKNLIMGQVTILKRGEVLKPPSEGRVPDAVAEKEKIEVKKEKIEDVSVLCSKDRLEETKIDEVSVLCWDRLGPEPEMVPKQSGLTDVKSVHCNFAGSVFLTSPPPSSLPLPGFFAKKVVPRENDVATTDLRRILRLDLLKDRIGGVSAMGFITFGKKLSVVSGLHLDF
ncbi:hypothetical protein NE237_029260 [Protea cynaroides]|uniref:Uncharacterized protein n=1 Tax=Protea cynaroides TaxID=273540 RepID=A0A9Q0JW36_9MAGN|nr:hypothetical protein NE237_029260 [Protea cynaroides]